MKAINYPDLVRGLRERHRQFFDKYSAFVEKNISERLLERGILLARLKLISKALKESGAISDFSEQDVLNHSNSIALLPSNSMEPFYLLNDCTEVIAASGGVASQDALTGRLVLVTSEANSTKTTFFKRYQDVLSEEFDWNVFAHEILEAIHKSLYNKSAVQKDFLTAELFK